MDRTSEKSPAHLSPAHRLPRWELITMLACLMALNALAIDIFIPALQAIGTDFHVADENQRQWVIPVYLLGFGIAQLIYGPVSDRFGRRPVLLFGLAVYVVAAFASLAVPTFGALLTLRFIQGLGTAAARVCAISIVRDSFDGRRMASVMSLVMMVFTVVPVFAPNIGQAVLILGDWQEVFLVTAALGLAIALWTGLRLPETLHSEYRRPLSFTAITRGFGIVLGNRQSLGYTLALAFGFGGLFGFINQAEQIFQGIYALGPLFTLAFSAIAIFIAAASFTNARLVERTGMRRLSQTALLGYSALTVAGFILSLTFGGVPPFPLFLVLMCAQFFSFGFLSTNFNALAMDPLGPIAGTGSSVVGFFQVFGGALIGGTIGYFYDGTLVPLTAGYVLLSAAIFLCVLLAERGRLFSRDGSAGPAL